MPWLVLLLVVLVIVGFPQGVADAFFRLGSVSKQNVTEGIPDSTIFVGAEQI